MQHKLAEKGKRRREGGGEEGRRGKEAECRHADMQTSRPGTMTAGGIAEHRDVQLYPLLVIDTAPGNHDTGVELNTRR